MLSNQLVVELKRACTVKNLLFWIAIIVFLPTIRFYTIRNGYQFYKPIEVFQETVSTIIPFLFPAIAISIYLPSFLQEKKIILFLTLVLEFHWVLIYLVKDL